MKLIGLVTTALLSVTLGATAPAYGQQQEQHDQQQEQKAKPEQNEEKKPQAGKPAKQQQKPAQQQNKDVKVQESKAEHNSQQTPHPQQKSAQQQHNQQPTQHTEQAKRGGGGRIPEANYRAHFGNEHRFRVSQANYRSRRFQYGGYSFGFVDPWPNNWLYTQDVYVIEINGLYYLCNPAYPGVNLALSFTL